MIHPCAHYFFVRDLRWLPEKSHVIRVHELLTRWELVDCLPQYFDFSDNLDVDEPLKALDAMPNNLAVVYPAPILPHSATRLGFDAVRVKVRLFLGCDYHLLASVRLWAEEIDPARDGDEPITLIKRWHHSLNSMLMFPTYPFRTATTPPKAKLQGWSAPLVGFDGVWRSCLVFETDHFGYWEGGGDLPAAAFVGELEAAIETPLIQVGCPQ